MPAPTLAGVLTVGGTGAMTHNTATEPETAATHHAAPAITITLCNDVLKDTRRVGMPLFCAKDHPSPKRAGRSFGLENGWDVISWMLRCYPRVRRHR